jgi:UDP-N-acetylmuramoylalanine-D-glutamate ligase
MHKNCLIFWTFLIFTTQLLAQNVSQRRKVVIGGDFNYPPYEFINEQSQPDGYNVELSRPFAIN